MWGTSWTTPSFSQLLLPVVCFNFFTSSLLLAFAWRSERVTWQTLLLPWNVLIGKLSATGGKSDLTSGSSTLLKRENSSPSSPRRLPMETRVFVAISTLLLGAIAWRMYVGTSEYEAHDLKFLHETNKYNWLVRRPDGHEMRLQFCQNFDVSQYHPQPGYVIETILAHDRGCLDILPMDKYLISWKKFKDGPDKGLPIKEDL